MRESGDKVPDDKKAGINEALEALKIAHQSNDLTAIDAAMDTLNKSS